MLAKRIIPCLDVDNGRVVKGIRFVSLVDAGDAVEQARGYDAPLVTEIHGGPHTLYGWSPYIEFQVLAGAGIGVWYWHNSDGINAASSSSVS